MMPSRPPTLDTLTMTPCPRSSIRGKTANVSRIGARKLTRMTVLDLGRIQRIDGPALRHGGVVDQHVDAAQVIPCPQPQLADRRGFGQIGHPHRRVRRGSAAVRQDLGKTLRTAGDQSHHRAVAGQPPGQGGTDAR